MEDHPAKRQRTEEPTEAAQATVAQTCEAAQLTLHWGVLGQEGAPLGGQDQAWGSEIYSTYSSLTAAGSKDL